MDNPQPSQSRTGRFNDYRKHSLRLEASRVGYQANPKQKASIDRGRYSLTGEKSSEVLNLDNLRRLE